MAARKTKHHNDISPTALLPVVQVYQSIPRTRIKRVVSTECKSNAGTCTFVEVSREKQSMIMY